VPGTPKVRAVTLLTNILYTIYAQFNGCGGAEKRWWWVVGVVVMWWWLEMMRWRWIVGGEGLRC
jgi:hypothetical protein